MDEANRRAETLESFGGQTEVDLITTHDSEIVRSSAPRYSDRPSALPLEQELSPDRNFTPLLRYEPKQVIGTGAMGSVLLARDRDIGRNVAIKRLEPSTRSSRQMRWKREIHTLGQLDHPGIVPIHDVGQNADGTFYLVMKHVEGETLGRVLQRLRAKDPQAWADYDFQRRLDICRSLVDTLGFAHEKGFLHRDIKPENIIIGSHGQVTLIDWGLAKFSGDDEAPDEEADSRPLDPEEAARPSDATMAGTRLGTPLYMSPEQAAGDTASMGPQTDIYSLGVVCYELLSLTHYLSDLDTLPAVLDAVQHRNPKLAYWHTNDSEERMPIEFAYWLQRAMAKSLNKRFQNAAEMREGLDDAISGNYDVVCPTTMIRRLFHRAGKFANQHPVTTLSATLAIVGSLVANFVYLIARWI